MQYEGGIVSANQEDGRGPRREPRGVSPAIRSSVLMMALLMGVGGALIRDAVAQELPAQQLPPGSVEVGAGRSVDLSPPTGLSGDGAAALSPEARLARGRQFVATIEGSSRSILQQLQTARKDRDVVRVLCLSDKLNQVDVASRSAQDRLGALKIAVERADADGSRHEFTVLEVLNDRVRVLVNESNQCVGEETGFIGEAEVSVSIDPNLPDADTDFGYDWYPPPLPSISSPIE
jgi:hypothetical protein